MLRRRMVRTAEVGSQLVTFHAPGCTRHPAGGFCAFGDRNPVPERSDNTRRCRMPPAAQVLFFREHRRGPGRSSATPLRRG